MFGFGKRQGLGGAIEEGVTEGLQRAFAPGGGAFKAFDDALAPIFAEMRELRRYKHRHQWRPLADAPECLLDGRPVLVARFGEAFWACHLKEPGEEGFWTTDIEYGGDALDPPPSHVFIVPKTPADPRSLAPEDASQHASDTREATLGEAKGASTPKPLNPKDNTNG